MNAKTFNALRRLADGEYCIGPDGGIWSRQGPLEVGVESAIKELLDALEAHWKKDRKSASGWQPIDTVPKDGRDLLLYGYWYNYLSRVADNVKSKTGVKGFELGFWDTVTHFWRTSKEYPCFEPTHWQPLPAAPEEKSCLK